MRSAELAHALDGLYDAAVTPDRWPDVLHQFARATGSVGCLFYPQHAERTGLVFPASPDMRGFLTDFVQEGWWLADHRANRGWPLLEGGAAVLVEHDVASDEERRTLPYYGELLARHDLPWWAGDRVHFRRPKMGDANPAERTTIFDRASFGKRIGRNDEARSVPLQSEKKGLGPCENPPSTRMSLPLR
ncbi:MAG TPA: hypothetical protein VME69_05240 [Methylocella sp.]|nr:hypothetical protein [Methylocella sp.]